MKKLFRNWSAARWFKLAVALAMLGVAVGYNDRFAYLVAAFFGLQAVLNLGCCGVACTSPSDRSSERKDGSVVYEEIH